MMSLVSAYGPSVTVLFFPPTTLPERSSGCPMLFSFPFFSSSLNQAIHFCIDCCASCGLSVLMSVVPRYRKTYSLISDLLENIVRSPYERSRMADPDIILQEGSGAAQGPCLSPWWSPCPWCWGGSTNPALIRSCTAGAMAPLHQAQATQLSPRGGTWTEPGSESE